MQPAECEAFFSSRLFYFYGELSAAPSSDEDEPAFMLKRKVSAKKTPEDKETVMTIKTDAQFRSWMDEEQVSNRYLFAGAKRLPEKQGGDVSIEQVIASFGTMKYFRESGKIEYPAMTMLARIQFSRLENSGFR